MAPTNTIERPKTSEAKRSDAQAGVNEGLRKAAILASSLGRTAADNMLEQLGPEQARQVRQIMMDLGEIDPKERRRVIDEFVGAGKHGRPKRSAGVELDSDLAQRIEEASKNRECEDLGKGPQKQGVPFKNLHGASDGELAKILVVERPQTIAMVLSHLPPKKAGNLLARLPGDLQVDVLHRLVDLEETEPDILHEVEQALEARLVRELPKERPRVAGLGAIAGILEASDSNVGMSILDNLAERNDRLADQLSPEPIAFADLESVDDVTLQEVFRAADPDVVFTALVDAPPRLVERILAPLSEEQREIVRHKLDYPGPIRLSDVEEAQRRIAQVTRRLMMEGRIRSPQRQAGMMAGV